MAYSRSLQDQAALLEQGGFHKGDTEMNSPFALRKSSRSKRLETFLGWEWHLDTTWRIEGRE
jgi:hypothetical protein